MWSNLQSSFTAKINMSCYRISTLLCLTALLALWPHVTEAQLKLTNFNMTRAVEILAERFRQVATDGLGIDALKDNYQQASYSYSDLNGSYIQQLLSNSSFPETINQVLTLFDDVVSDSTSGGSVDPVECCSASAGSAEVCCYSCSSPASSTISTIAGAYANSDLIDSSTLLFASPSGALLTQPPSADCDGAVKDGRLQTWFTNATRENPVEMVVVLDVFRRPVFITNDSLYGELVNGVTTVLRSLNNKDRIALVGVDVNSPRIPRASIFSATETTPICPEAVLELEAFMTSFSPSGMADYNAAFEKAFSFFSNDLDTDKLLLFFTSGLGGSGENSLLANITRLKNSRNNSVSLSVFRIVNDGVSNFESITSPDGFVVDLSDDHVTLRAPLSSLVAGYYQLNQSALTPSDDVFYSHAINRAGGALSLTRPYFNRSSLVGVFRALLPWQQLLGHIFSALMDRPSSYPFVTDRYGRVLYHPLIPSDGDENVHIADLETETNDIMGVLESLGSATIQMHPVVKQLLRHTGSEDENAFFPHNTTSDYYCHQFALNNGDILYLCIVLAEVDMSVASLNSINPSVVYEDGVTAPLYHNLQLSASEEQTCNYFCKRSLNDRVSFQLTGPGVPADSASFVDEVTEFVTGDRSTAPGGVDPLVATEIALASRSVASTWTNTSSAPSGYITRRHLATSSGVYLSYPAVQINKNFIPSLTEWYQASVARGNLLTLTPPRMDSLNEAGQFAISAAYTVRARRQSQQSPNPTGITRPLAVVAADLTLSSVRSFIREAVPGCEEDGSASCLIIDDMINLIYDRDTYSRSGLGSSPRFLGKPLINEQFFQYQGVLFDLIRRVSSDLLTKMQCVDYYSTDIETRRFYRLDTSVIKLFMNVSRFCVDYLLQHIPDTNSFLLIVKQKSRSCRGQIVCGCSTGNKCTNCNDFSTEFCECPCVCSDNCRRDPGRRVLACPAINTMDNFVAAESASLTDSSALLDPPFCFNQGCNCRGQDSCLSSRECSWCEAERRCVHVSDCCSRDESGACCGQSPQLDRFRGYGSCITDVCLSQPGAFDVTCPTIASSGQTSLIVAVVVGCTFGLILIVFLVIFIIWYQFFRKSDVAEETSRESAFDFSKKRMETVNPMANSAPDVKSDNGNDVGNATKSTSPHPPSEKPEKTDLSEKSNGKDETFL